MRQHGQNLQEVWRQSKDSKQELQAWRFSNLLFNCCKSRPLVSAADVSAMGWLMAQSNSVLLP